MVSGVRKILRAQTNRSTKRRLRLAWVCVRSGCGASLESNPRLRRREFQVAPGARISESRDRGFIPGGAGQHVTVVVVTPCPNRRLVDSLCVFFADPSRGPEVEGTSCNRQEMTGWNSITIELDDFFGIEPEFVIENRAAASVAQVEVDRVREVDHGRGIGCGPMDYTQAARLIEPILDAAIEFARVSVFAIRTAVVKAHALAKRFAPPDRAVQSRCVPVQFVRSAAA